MKFKSIYLMSLVAICLPMAAHAQTPPPTVTFGAVATMPSLKDASKKDTFVVTLGDAQVKTQLELTCSAGYTTLLIVRSDKACAVAGNGSIVNPSNQQLLPRTQYAGGYVVKSDGYTDGSTLSINYLAVGKVGPSTSPFAGSMSLKPEVTSTGAAALRDVVLKQIDAGSTELIDQRVDTVDLSRLYIPSAGLPSDEGCTWSGNMVFAYQTESWFLNLTANCAGKDYVFKGNMPWTDSPGVANQTQYDLTLTLPSAESMGDDALFATGDANSDLFATVDGITAQITMKESNHVTIDVDGVPTETPSQVDASGTFTGTNVPLEVVRSLATLFGLLSSNLFGA
ncbi:MAG: hypothetical protein ACYCZU_14495 [Devosia sp.]